MAELAMLAEIQRIFYPDEVTCQLHVMAQVRGSLPVIDRRSNQCALPPTWRQNILSAGRQQVNCY